MSSNSGAWRRGSLVDLVQLKRGHDLPEPRRREGDVPVMGSAGLSGYHDESRAQGPGLVVGRSGASFGKVHFCEVDYWPLNTALYATDFRGNDPRFVSYALRTLDLSSFNSGSAQPSLNRNFIATIPMAIPPAGEQQRIAGVLGALDDKIESNRRLATVLEETAAALFRARFVDFVGVMDLLDSEIGPIPRGWTTGRLADIAHISNASTRPYDRPGDVFEHFSIPAFDADGRPEVVKGGEILSSKTRLPETPSLLLSKLNPATKRVWRPRPRSLGEAVCSPEFMVLVPADGTSLGYLAGVLAADAAFYARLLGYVTGTTGSRQRVKPGDAMAVRLVLPPVDERLAYGEVASPLLGHADGLRNESRTLAELRDSLLLKLVSGQIRVTDAEDLVEAT